MTNATESASAGAQIRILLKAEQYRSAGTEDANAQIAVPGVGTFVQHMLKISVLPWFVKHPRTLDAWIAKHRAALQKGWDNSDPSVGPAGVADGNAPGSGHLRVKYVPLPIRVQDTLPETLVQAPSPKWVASKFNSRRTILEIIGPGGSGKTTLARQIGTWGLAGSTPEGLPGHPMVPV
jgi:hypothetical protein